VSVVRCCTGGLARGSPAVGLGVEGLGVVDAALRLIWRTFSARTAFELAGDFAGASATLLVGAGVAAFSFAGLSAAISSGQHILHEQLSGSPSSSVASQRR
jgi:hypothetical protein